MTKNANKVISCKIKMNVKLQIVGVLLGFDDFVNMVLEDVTEYENTPEGRRVTKLDQILLHGKYWFLDYGNFCIKLAFDFPY